MTAELPKRSGRFVLLIVAIIVVIAVGAAAYVVYPRNASTSSGTTYCVISGPPGPTLLSVQSDSNGTQISGAIVTATYQPLQEEYPCGPSQTTITAPHLTVTFTTNGTQWYILPGTSSEYGFSVSYAGRNYTFPTYTPPDSHMCATLFLPSGRTNTSTACSP